MKRIAVAVLILSSLAFAADTCVILKRAPSSVKIWDGVEFYYVEGNYPPGYKFLTDLRGRNIRKLVKMGGRMAIVENNYTPADLEAARKTCAAPPVKKNLPHKLPQ